MLLLVDLPLVGNDGRSATSAAVDAAELAADPPIRPVENAKNTLKMSKQRDRHTNWPQGKMKAYYQSTAC